MSKGLERLKNKNLPCSNCKELKALEIVLNKRVCMDRLVRSDSATMYNEWNNWDEIDLSTYLTNDEFNLIKELLK